MRPFFPTLSVFSHAALGTLVGAVVLGVAPGCAARRDSVTCGAPAPRVLTTPGPPVWSQSSLFVEGHVPLSVFRAAVERQVPVVLA